MNKYTQRNQQSGLNLEEKIAKQELRSCVTRVDQKFFSYPGHNAPVAKKMDWERNILMRERVNEQIDRLSSQDAQFLAKEKYSDMTKFLVLGAVANEKDLNQRLKRYERAKQIWGTVAMVSAVASASFASTQHPNLALLAGLVSFGAIGALLFEKGGYDGRELAAAGNCINLCKRAEKDPDLRNGLQKLAPTTLSFSEAAKTCPSPMYVLQWRSGDTVTWP